MSTVSRTTLARLPAFERCSTASEGVDLDTPCLPVREERAFFCETGHSCQATWSPQISSHDGSFLSLMATAKGRDGTRNFQNGADARRLPNARGSS